VENYVVSATIEARKNAGAASGDDKLRELVAIGASVTAHCQPCLDYHLGKSREANATDAEISCAISAGELVGRGAATFMKEYIKDKTGVSAKNKSCCSGNAKKKNRDNPCCR
jgi:AhpD family alkylhydroperoxidase